MGSKAPHFRNPHNLPTKVCKRCGRPFHWRKKWARSWSEVQYCSAACRTQRRPADAGQAEEQAGLADEERDDVG